MWFSEERWVVKKWPGGCVAGLQLGVVTLVWPAMPCCHTHSVMSEYGCGWFTGRRAALRLVPDPTPTPTYRPCDSDRGTRGSVGAALTTVGDLADGRTLEAQGDIRGAIEAYEAVLSRHPTLSDAYHRCGSCYYLLRASNATCRDLAREYLTRGGPNPGSSRVCKCSVCVLHCAMSI